MSKPIQTVEELDAVLHWRGKHALAIRERDALQQLLNQRDEQVESLERQREAELRNGQDLQQRLTAANQQIDDLRTELAAVRLGPCKMIVGDELP